jgi:hypothetical protein
MAVSVTDPAYRAEVVPVTIEELGDLLCARWGVGPLAFGDRGNLQHTSGYHRSRRYNLIHAPSNYSIQLAADRAGDPDWISAFDFTPAVWGTLANRAQMMTITKRMRAAARAHDPRVSALREFAGTEDGVTVVTIDMQTGGNRSPFDSSHLDHGHGSLFRSRAADDHTGIFEVMAGIPSSNGGTFMTALTDQQQQDLWEWLALLVDTKAVVRPGDRFQFVPLVMQAAKLVPGLVTQVTALTATVQALADVINAGDGNVDTASIFAKIDEAVAEIEAKQRDAVADLGEGGALKVRGPQD